MRRNSCRGGWATLLNAQVSRLFGLGRGQSLELTVDLFNALNFFDRDWGSSAHVRARSADAASDPRARRLRPGQPARDLQLLSAGPTGPRRRRHPMADATRCALRVLRRCARRAERLAGPVERPSRASGERTVWGRDGDAGGVSSSHELPYRVLQDHLTNSGARMPTVHPRHFRLTTAQYAAICPELRAHIRRPPRRGPRPRLVRRRPADRRERAETPLSAEQTSVSRISVCHRSGATGTIVEVSPADLAERLKPR